MFRFRLPTWFVLLLPAIIVLTAVVLIPLLLSLYSSFTPYRLTRPETLYKWIGTFNYEKAIESVHFWSAFGRTILLLTIALNLEMLLGLGLALLVNRITYGQRALRTIMMFPMMFSPLLVGFQFKFIFNDNIGLVNNALQSLGLTNAAIPWLVDGQLAFFSILVAEMWSSTSVFAILIQASKVDGCTAWQSFRHITLPFIMPFIYIALAIRSLDVARAFDIVQIMTNGGPARRTELLWTLIGRTGYVDAKMGYANAMGYVSIFLAIFFTVFFFKKLSAARAELGMAD